MATLTYSGEWQRAKNREGREKASCSECALSYDGSGNLDTVTDPTGRTLTFDVDGDNHITDIHDSNISSGYRTVHFDYDSNDDLVAATDGEGNTTDYTYDDHHQMTDKELPGHSGDPGEHWTWEYDESGRAVSVKGVSDHGKVTYKYDPANLATAVFDSNGNENIFRYNAAGEVTDILDPDGKHLRYTWDADGNQTAIIDQAGHRTSFAYDSDGNITQVKRPLPSSGSSDGDRPTTNMTYGDYGRLESITGPLAAQGGTDSTTTYTYDGSGNLLTVEDPYGNGPTYDYPSGGSNHGQPDSVTDARGHTVDFSYDSDGNLDQVTNAVGAVTTYSHDGGGRLTSKMLHRSGGGTYNLTIDYTYDKNDRLTETELPPATSGGTRYTRTKEYDERGNVLTSTDELGHETTYTYDRQNHVKTITDPEGREVQYTYDTEGNLTQQEDLAGRVTTFDYNKQNQLLKSTLTGASGSTDDIVTEIQRDSTGQVEKVIKPSADFTRYLHDGDGNLTAVKNYDHTSPSTAVATTAYEYDKAGNLTKTTDANSHETTFTYDLNSQNKRKTDPHAKHWDRTYDENGNLATSTDGNGNTTTFTYDDADRLTNVDYPSGTHDVATTYDDKTNDVLSVDDGTGTTDYTYDGLGQVTQEDLPGSRTITRTYDPDGRETSVTLPGSDERQFDWNDADQLTQVKDKNNREFNYDYDSGSGELDHIDYPVSGSGVHYEYDAFGRISQVKNKSAGGSTLKQLDYDYDKNSNVTAVDEGGSNTAAYNYDALDRLTEEDVNGTGATDRAYTYDPAGNRLTETRDDGSGTIQTDYTPGDANELLSKTRDDGAGGDPTTTTTYGYDDNGNQTSKEVDDGPGGSPTATTDYTWDAADRLTGVALPGGAPAETYAYDAQDRRVSETVGTGGSAVTTAFTFDGQEVAQETAPVSGSPLTSSLVREPADGGLLLERDDGNSSHLRYYHPDALGSPTALTDNSGTSAGNYRYTAFGEEIDTPATPPNGRASYLGNTLNPATKLNNFQARSYDASEGRFISRDPLAGNLTQPVSQNPYEYGLNNPLYYRDRNGRGPEALGGGGVVVTGVLLLSAYAIYEDPELINHPLGAVGKGAGALNDSIFGGSERTSSVVTGRNYPGAADDGTGFTGNAFALAQWRLGQAFLAESDDTGDGETGGEPEVWAGQRKKESDIPPEARKALEKIDAKKRTGFEQDGDEWRNDKDQLPKKPAGYYSEYTVEKPGFPGRRGGLENSQRKRGRNVLQL